MHLNGLPLGLSGLFLLGLFNLCLGLPTGNEARQEQQSQLQPLLTTAQRAPDLSIFYSLFAGTGGESGTPGPSLEERFNDPASSLQYTLLAPTNDGFASISPAFLKTVTSIPAYELLLTLLRNFILPEQLTFSQLTPKAGIRAVGGFMFDIEPDGSIQTNEGITQSAVPIRKEANLLLSPEGQPLTIPASNGIIYKIDRMFDPLITYFGEDAPTEGNLPPVTRQAGTMADILRTNPNLTALYQSLSQVNPDFLNRLSLFSPSPATNARTVYLAPSNSAFEVLPKSIARSVSAPSNQAANSLLLEFGLGGYGEGEMVMRSFRGFNVSVGQGRVNNAGVQERVCCENGCVWLVGRWVDPLFGAFEG